MRSTVKHWVLVHTHRVLVGCVVVAIVASAAPTAAATTANGSAPIANSVRDVQQRLAALRFLPPSHVDGKLGPRTQHAITAFQQWHGLTPDGIAGPRTKARLATAGVPAHRNTGPAKRIEIYRAKGVTLMVENGKVTRAMHSSAGKRGYATPPGSYRVLHQVLKDWSSPYQVWMPYASYFHRGYAIHEGAVPTYPASHGCVRLTSWDAPDAYRFATIGTAVIVY
ncbi:MAG: L,D-transpeptidase family protein [Solirubrobacteraceae bacterium]